MSSCCHCAGETEAPVVRTPATEWFSFGLLIMLAGLAMIATLALNITPPTGIVRTVTHTILAGISLVCLAIYGRQVFRRAAGMRITLETLFLIGLFGAFAGSLYSSLTGTGHIYYEVVLVLLAIYRLGQNISRSRIEKWNQITNTIPGLGGEARIQTSDCGKTESIPVSQIKVGDTIIVSPDEVIPIDGEIREGRAYIEELPHTGEPFPVPRDIGEKVRAGTRVLDGEIRVTAKVDGTAREIDRLSASLEKENQKTRAEKLAQRILNLFVPAVLVASVGTLLYWGFALGNWDRAIFNALAVTIVACPCGLGLAIPLAASRGRFRLRLLGIRDADSELLDRLAEVDTVVFDKTGTLSEGRLELSAWEVADDAPVALRSWLAAIQRTSTHPVARVFWDVAEPAQLKNLQVTPIPARGIEARFTFEEKDHTLVIANSLYRNTASSIGEKRKLYVYLDSNPVATVTLEESARGMVAETITALHDRNLEIEIMTGDATVPQEFADSINAIHAGISSQEKFRLVRERQQQGRTVLFIGDGLNDAEALRAADASLAMEGGSSAATGSAHALLEHGNLLAIPEALDLARNQRRKVARLLQFVLGYNLTGILLAMTGVLHPVAAALLMLGSSATVLTRSGK